MSGWDPAVYLRFGAERTRPAADLLARVPLEAPRGVVDLGCGPGNSTALLAARYPGAPLAGLDSSAEMIRAAAASGVPARFEVGDFEAFTPGPDDQLVFANAAFQWAHDPLSLVRRLAEALPVGGVLAFQIPQNFDAPSHTAVRAVAEAGPWAARTRGARQYDPGFTPTESYARALLAAGLRLDLWRTTYWHVLEGPDPVFRWMSGTGLRPFFDALAGEELAAFTEAVRAALAAAYPPEPDGRTLFPFQRLFAVAERA